jgi:two-component system, NtrC family, nitrogen regulation response regulator GlnG
MKNSMVSKDTIKGASGLGQIVSQHIKNYLSAHEGQMPAPGLYKRILTEVEKPLILSILDSVNGSQVKAAKILGLSRNTLRKKIEELKIKVNAA